MTGNLTKRQQQILHFIADRQQEGWTPSVREIGDAVGLRSSAAVQKHLNRLEQHGYIRRLNGRARSIQLLRPDAATHDNLVVPILGEITAGAPILAEQHVTGYLTVVDEALLAKPGAFFALKVKGESMIEAGILPGDYVVVMQQPTAANGEIVAALIGDEATIKRFYKERTRIRLQPANAAMQPILVRDVQILGRVVSVIRRI